MNKQPEHNIIQDLKALSPTEKERNSMLQALAAYTQAKTNNSKIISPYRLQVMQRYLSRVAVLALIFSFSGSGVGFAAADSLPGDFLYPVKRAIKNIEISLVQDDTKRLQKTAELVEEKVVEVEKLIENGDLNSKTQAQVSRDIASLSEGIAETTAAIKEENPIQAIKVATEIESEIALSHSKLLTKADPEAQIVASAIENSAEILNSANNEAKQQVLGSDEAIQTNQNILNSTAELSEIEPQTEADQQSEPESEMMIVAPQELLDLESSALDSLDRFAVLLENPDMLSQDSPFYQEISNSFASMQQLYQAANDASQAGKNNSAFVYYKEIVSHTEKAFIYLDEALSLSNLVSSATEEAQESEPIETKSNTDELDGSEELNNEITDEEVDQLVDPANDLEIEAVETLATEQSDPLENEIRTELPADLSAAELQDSQVDSQAIEASELEAPSQSDSKTTTKSESVNTETENQDQ